MKYTAESDYIPGRWLTRHEVIDNTKVTFKKFVPSVPVIGELEESLWRSSLPTELPYTDVLTTQEQHESFKDFKERTRDVLEELKASQMKGKHGEVIPLQFRITHKEGNFSTAADRPYGGGRGVLIRPEQAPGLEHVLTAHELGHVQFQKEHPNEELSYLKSEVAAWKNAAINLRKTGEWNKRAKALATVHLTSNIRAVYATSKSKAHEAAIKIVGEL